MSKTIDQRVVEMRFDNKQFESGVSTTMSTLDKLKQKLNLNGASKGLDNIGKSAKNVNMSGLGSAVETVTAKFSALQVMGVTALANITNSAVNAGKNIVKSLTIDPVKTGFSEYETKLGSIQTILANTEHQGTTLNDVTRALDELNLYADKTIYNFQEMTRNIGTFTAAGVDLDTSVRSIQGIANLAAVSGSTSQQASTAMYQLSQALATGTVKLMDWNSVVNAGMGGKVFQNALIQTAAVLDGAAEDVEAWQKKNIDAYGSFRDSLTQGEWLTSEVLTKTLEQFTMAAEEGSAEWEEFKKSLMDDGYTKAQAESILKMANTATDAATKVKTFTQLMDTLKESAQSGWAQTWELLIGDFEEAKSFFTELSDLFGGILGDSANRRNTLISDAMSSSWDKLIKKINDAGIETEKFEESIRKVVGDSKLDNLVEEYGSIQKAAEEGAISSDTLKKALDGIGAATEKISIGTDKLSRTLWWGHEGEDVKQLQNILDKLGHDLGEQGVDGIMGAHTYKAIKEFQKANNLYVDGIAGPKTIAALKEAAKGIDDVTDSVEGQSDSVKKNIDSWDKLVDEIGKTSGRELLLDSVMNVIKAIQRPLAAVGEAFRNTFSISSDQLYGALEKLNKFTKSFVMGGILDITEWHELTAVLDQLGIKTGDFTNKLQGTLKDHGVDVAKLRDEYGSLANAFNEGAISLDIIKETLLKFDGISESMLLGGENADKVRRAFEGLFAVLEIAGSIAGGGLKFAFEVLSAVLGKFDLNVLDLVANMGDAIVAFRDWVFEENLVARSFDALLAKLPGVISRIKEWFNAFKQTPAVQKLVDAINAIISAFDKLTSGEMSLTEFANNLGTNLANALKSLPGIATQIASDFIAGFTSGINSSVSGVISKVVSFALEFVSAFAAALGVQSPSWKAFEIVVDFFKGAANGANAALSGLLDVFKTIGNQIVEVFKSFWDFITDESGRIEWDKIFAGGIIFSTLWVVKQLATAFSGIAEAFEGFGDILDNAGVVIKKFGKVLDGYAWDLKAKALQKMAVAIAILVGAIWVLTTIDSPGKLWNAVGIIAALAGIVVLLAFAMDKLSKASVSIDKSGANIEGLKTGLIQIGIVIALLALTVKMIGSMDIAEAKQGFLGLAGIAVGLIAFMATMAGISRFSGDVSGFGKTMLLLSVALLVMTTVIKRVAKLEPADIFSGIIVMEAFILLMAQMALINRIAGPNAKMGSSMIGMAIAMGLMVGVIKLISGVDPADVFTGLVVMEAFVLLMVQMGLANRIAGRSNKVGGTMLGMAMSMMMLVGVIKIISSVDVADIIKGVLVMQVFVLMIAEMLVISRLGKDTGKVAGTILSMSVAIAILAGIAVLLSMIDVGGLAKGIVAVGLLSMMMATMAKSLKGAQNVAGAIGKMAIAIGIMAAAVVALSFIDPADLAGATASLSILMGMFALMLQVSKKAQMSVGSMLIMLGAIVILAGVLTVLSGLNVGSTLEVAASISLLMMTLGVTMKLIGKTGAAASSAIGPMAALAIIAGMIGLVLVGLSKLDPGPTLDITASISALMLTLAVTMRLIGSTGALASSAIGPMFALTIMAGLIGLMLVGLTKLNPGPTLEIAVALSAVLLAMSGAALILSMIGPAATAGIGGAAAFLGLVLAAGAILGAIGGLIAKIPGAQEFLDSGIPIMESIGKALGSLIGGVIGGIGEGITSSLPTMIEDIKTFASGLADVATTVSGIEAGSFDGVQSMVKALLGISVGSLVEHFASSITGESSMESFKTSAISFVDAIAAISNRLSTATINSEAISTITNCGLMFTELNKSLPKTGGIAQDLAGEQDLALFARSCRAFGNAMISINEAVSVEGFAVQSDKIEALVEAGSAFNKLNTALPRSGGLAQDIAGEQELAVFGTKCKAFAGAMLMINEAVSAEGFAVQSDKIEALVEAGRAFNKLNTALPKTGGIAQDLAGEQDLAAFGTSCTAFVSAMSKVSTAVSGDGVSINLDAVETMKRAGLKFNELQNVLPKTGGWWESIAGESDLADFGSKIEAFGTAMSKYSSSVSELNNESINASITTAYRIRTLVESLAGLDASGLNSFAGVGLGDGHLVNMGQAIGKYGEAVADLNVEAVNTSVSAAMRLKTLIGGLAGLDTSGIENFKIGSIGSAIKSYASKVGDINTSTILTSITAANRLKTFISGLAGLDTSGVSNFKVDSVGSAIKNYAASVKGVNVGAILASINAANQLKSFINGLSGINTSGVGSFKSAIAELSTISIGDLVSTFTSASVTLASAGTAMIMGLVNGIRSGIPMLSSVMQNVITSMIQSVSSQVNAFGKTGSEMTAAFAKGISSKASAARNATNVMSKNAASGAKSGYASMYSAGSYLVTGFVSGINSNSFRAAIAARAMARAAVEAARAALDINSPSKVFRALGYSVPEGFAMGIDKLSKMSTTSSENMATAAINTVRKSISRISDVITSDIDTQPTIRPVLDLSDVSAGASAIGSMLGSTIGVSTNVGAISTMMNRRSQNGVENEVVSAINKLRKDLGNIGNTSYNINGITYDDGSNVATAVREIVRAARTERRV